MAPPIPKRWTTDPEYIELLNYLIRRTENVESPMSIKRLAKEFKEKSVTVQSEVCFERRIASVRTRIYCFEHIDTNTKVKLIFALSAPVKADFLKELNEDALVRVDEEKRITHYKAKDGSLELNGDHSRSEKNRTAMLEAKGSIRSLIINYFETKNDADAIPQNDEQKEMGNLIEVERYGREIQKGEFLDTQTKVQQLFGLSATVDSDCLKELRKNALVDVDEKNRITYYKVTNGGLELRGDHSRSLKTKTAHLESKRSLRSLIIDYFENKDDANAISQNEEEKEMGNLIEFITEKCVDVDKPISITRLARDFKYRFGISKATNCIRQRVKTYGREIQKMEFLDTLTKVKQLFGLSASVDPDYLEKLRKDAVVEVDDQNRITKYTSRSSRLALYGDHSQSAKGKLSWIVRRKNKKRVKKHSNSGGGESEESEKEDEYSEDNSDGYSSKEFDSEFDSDDENDHLDESEDLVDSSNETVDFEKETPIRIRSPTEMSTAENFEFDPPTERSCRSAGTEMREFVGEENDPEITASPSIKTRSGRLSKRRHLDSAFSNNQVLKSSSSGASVNTESASSNPAKQKKIATANKQVSINRSSRNSSFSTFSTDSGEKMENQDAPRTEENPSDYDYNPREANTPESLSTDNCVGEPEPSAAEEHNPSIEAQNNHIRSDAVAPESEPVEEVLTPQNNKNTSPPTNGKEVISPEVPIKVENEEPVTVEDHPEDVKPEIAHNPKIKFFKAMQSLILFLDTPSLSNLQSKIQQRIRKMKGSKEVIQNNELIPTMKLLVARMTNNSVVDISGSVESVSLIQFFCYLKASILNSKMIGVEGLMNNISGLIEKSHNKRIPIEKVAEALRVTLDIDDF